MYIPSVPSPGFLSILRTLFGRKTLLPGNIFTSNDKPCYQFYSRGSEALTCITRDIAGENAIVFIPAYFCNESLDNLRNSSAQLVFYKINPDLSPNWQHLDELSRKFSPDIFVLTQYFGTVNDVNGAANFCSLHECELIHDCAHHLIPSNEIIQSPGIVIFSPHKLLPVPPLSLVICDKTCYAKLSQTHFTLVKSSELSWLVKRMVQKYLSFLIIKGSGNTDLPPLSGAITTGAWIRSNVSLFSLFFYKAAIFKISFIQKLRFENYRNLDELVSSSTKSDIETFKLNKLVCPYLYIFSSSNLNHEIIFQYLRKNNIPVNTWPDLAPEVAGKPEYFNNAIILNKELLFLPVHQDIKNNQYEYIQKILIPKLSGS